MLEEQTVVLLGRMTRFTAICDACVEEQLAELARDAWLGTSFSGSLDVEHDFGWVCCERGHRVRVIRAGRSAEPVLH
jgi:hypothetical protein